MVYESAAYIILTMPSLDLQLNYLNSIMAQQNVVVGESFDLLKHRCLIKSQVYPCCWKQELRFFKSHHSVFENQYCYLQSAWEFICSSS